MPTSARSLLLTLAIPVFLVAAQALYQRFFPWLPLPTSTPRAMAVRTPVYFLSHGGPNLMEDYDHPAYAKLQEIGKEITHSVRPRAVVVFSAHWQAGPATIEVNTAEQTDLIYE